MGTQVVLNPLLDLLNEGSEVGADSQVSDSVAVSGPPDQVAFFDTLPENTEVGIKHEICDVMSYKDPGEMPPLTLVDEYVDDHGVVVKKYKSIYSQDYKPKDVPITRNPESPFGKVTDYRPETGHTTPKLKAVYRGDVYYVEFESAPAEALPLLLEDQFSLNSNEMWQVPQETLSFWESSLEYTCQQRGLPEFFDTEPSMRWVSSEDGGLHAFYSGDDARYVYLPDGVDHAQAFTENGMMEISRQGIKSFEDPVLRIIWDEMNSWHEPIDLVSKVDKAPFQNKAGLFKYVSNDGHVRYVYIPPTPDSGMPILPHTAEPNLMAHVPEMARSAFPAGQISAAELGMNTGAVILFIVPGLIAEYTASRDGQMTPTEAGIVTGTHVTSGVTGLGVQLGMEYMAATRSGLTGLQALKIAGASTGATAGCAAYSGVAAYAATDVVAEDVWGMEDGTFERNASVLVTAGILAGAGFAVGFAAGGPLGGVIGALAVTIAFAGGSLIGWRVDEDLGEALTGEPFSDSIGEAAAQSETVRAVHDTVEEHPWLAYAGVSMALTGTPLPGLAIYGIKEGYEWLTEPVDMEVDNPS